MNASLNLFISYIFHCLLCTFCIKTSFKSLSSYKTETFQVCSASLGVTYTKKSMPCTAQIHNIVRIALKCDTKPSRDRIPRDRENPLV